MRSALGKQKRIHVFWRVAWMFGLATLIWLLVQNTISALYGGEYSRTTHILRAVSVFALAVPAVMAANKFLDGGTSLRRLGLDPLRQAWRPLLIGMAAWLIPAAAGFGLCLLAGWVDISVVASPEAIALNVLSLLALVFIFEAFPEELIFRGYIFHNLAAVKPLWMAVIGQAVLFTLWGTCNGGEITVDRTILFLVFGTILGMVRAITGSLWVTIGYHLAFQAAAQLFSHIGGDQFEISSSQTLAALAFGIIPAALSLTVLRWFYKKHTNWQGREAELGSK